MDAQSLLNAQNQALLHEDHPQLDTIETSGLETRKSAYRDFMVDSCKPDIDFTRLVYNCIDGQEYTRSVEKFDACRTYANFVRNKKTKQVRIHASACRLRWCPLCMKTKRMIIVQECKKWIHGINKPKFLTFTLKHRDEPLRDTIKDLYKFFRNVRRTKWFKKNVRGGVWFFQITKSKNDDLWHPHIHCLVDSNFLPKAELSELWELITGDSKIVDIRAIKDNQKTAEYVARYAAAPCRLLGFGVDDAIEIVQTMFGKRICGTWGTGKTMSFRITKPDDWEDWETIGNWSVIWNDKANPHWCRYIRLCWIHDEPCEYNPPPDLMDLTGTPWDDNQDLESFKVTQLEMF